MKPEATLQDMLRAYAEGKEETMGGSTMLEAANRIDELEAALDESEEACAKVCEARAIERFVLYGVYEPDTGLSYYPDEFVDKMTDKDEEDADCAEAIRKLSAIRADEYVLAQINADLRAENEKLKIDLEGLKHLHEGYCPFAVDLKAENKKLREALSTIERRAISRDFGDIARAALEKER